MAAAMKSPDTPAGHGAPGASFYAAMTAVVVIATVTFSACGASLSAPGANDDGVIRVVGLGWTGAFGALDRLAAALPMLVPIGTGTLRASLASSFVAGACAWATFDLARLFATFVLARVLGGAPAPRLVLAVAAAAALTASLGPGFQREAAAPGGAVVGALVILLALREVARGALEGDALRPAACALLLGLAATCDLAVLGATTLAVATQAPAMVARLRGDPTRAAMKHAVVAFVVGLAPLATALAARARVPEIADDAGPRLFSSLASDRALRAARGLPAVSSFLTFHVGPALVVLAGVAAVLVAVALRRSGRGFRGLASLQLALFAVVLAGAGAAAFLGGATPDRASSVVLAASAALHAQASVALAGLALGIARAPVPFAQASASLVVVLELVLPVRAADEALGQRAAAGRDATEIWSEVAFGAAPPASLVLATHPRLARRIAAARAAGEMRGDVVVVPASDVRSRMGTRALVMEPKLAPLYRDLALGSPPEELSLTQLATARPVLVSFDPTWDRSLARHLTPAGLLARFDPEPRGTGDRRKAFEQVGPLRDRLVRAIVAHRDHELVALTATLLRARALGVAATADKELLSRALDDLRPFAPEDPVAAQLVRRIVTSKGTIEVRDLAP
jgi:hypothetical protein